MQALPISAILKLPAASIVLLFSVSFAAQDEEAGSSDAVDEITVYAEKPMWRLRKDIEIAEDQFYDLFNQLIDDPQFRLTCRNEAPTDSHIKRRTCRARFEDDADEAEAQGELRLSGIGRRGHIGGADWAVIRYKNNLLKEKMAQMAAENTAVLDALIKIDTARQNYESQREERCEGRWFFCAGKRNSDTN